MKKLLPKIIGVLIILGLFIPISQQYFGYMYVVSLNGVTPTDTTKLSYSWWNRDFQKRTEKYCTDSLSLRPACVRLRNQVEFSFFDKVNAQDIFEYEGIFFRHTYLTYSEKSAYVGQEKIERQVHLLKEFQQLLNKDSIPIYVFITPSKLHYYKSQLPAYNQTNSQLTNVIQYKKALKKAGIRVFDADAWFLQEKHKHTASLFSTIGAHWTLYGAAIAMDSMIRRINHDKSTDFQRVYYDFVKDGRTNDADIDIVRICNLIFPPKDPKLNYVNFPSLTTKKKQIKPMVVGDSFFDATMWTGMGQQILDSETPFYFYYHTRFTWKTINKTFTKNNVQQDIKNADCIIIITDIQNMEQFGFGFIERYIQEVL